jgi:hypothetical protein
MAWPKRGTRKIVVDGEDFFWHYDACCPWCSDDVFTAGKSGAPYVLFIDPFPFAPAFELGPRAVAEAIRWARANGWTAESGPTRALSLNEQTAQFEWLAEGQRHLACVGKIPDNV